MRAWTTLLLVLATIGCDSGSSNPPNNDIPDAMPGPQNALGSTCTASAECPAMPQHTCVFLSAGNPNLGYCSPPCTTDPDCSTGFSGPGMATCFVPGQPNVCSIICESACPGDLVCADLGGGGVKVCVTQ
jgi:hypothetical protein